MQAESLKRSSARKNASLERSLKADPRLVQIFQAAMPNLESGTGGTF